MINCFKDPIHVLMSVLLCKILCLLICFCKPLSHIYAASSLNLVNTPHKSLKTLVSATNDDDDAHQEVVDHVDGHRNGEVREEEDDTVDAKEEEGQVVGDTLPLKTSLRKVDSKTKKKVQWVDLMGIKELAEIREFEPSEEDDIDSDRGKTCVCVIL